jgi:hypothetical protein
MPRIKLHATSADRVKAHRERHSLKQMTIELPQDVFDQFEQYLKFKDLTKSQVITKLICTQILRKR